MGMEFRMACVRDARRAHDGLCGDELRSNTVPIPGQPTQLEGRDAVVSLGT